MPRIVLVPAATPVARPPALIVAAAAVPEDHTTLAVRFCVVPFVYVPVAVNCNVVPDTIEGFAGVIAIETSAAAVTVKFVDPEIAPEVAFIKEVPTATPVARPPALIVEVAGTAELHVTLAVKFCVVLLLNVPVAVNCCVRPAAIEGFAGVTAMDTSVADVTVKVVEPEIAPDVAFIKEVPAATPVAKPPAVMVAVAGVAELHVTLAVRFCVVLLLNVPVAVNCCVRPAAIEGFAGVTAMDTSVGAVTVKSTVLETVPEVALIPAVPAAIPVAKPLAVIVAAAGVLEVQATLAVRFCVEPSVNVPVAVNCTVSPAAIDGLTGVTAIETSVGAVTVKSADAKMLPEVAVIVDVPMPTPVARPVLPMSATPVLAELQFTLPVILAVLPSL